MLKITNPKLGQATKAIPSIIFYIKTKQAYSGLEVKEYKLPATSPNHRDTLVVIGKPRQTKETKGNQGRPRETKGGEKP